MISCVLLVGTLAGCSESPNTLAASRSSAAPAPIPMPTRLARLVAEADPFRHPTVKGEQRAARYRADLPTIQDPRRHAQLRLILGMNLMVDGDTDGALAEFEGIERILAAGALTVDGQFRKRLVEAIGICNLRKGEQENCLALHSPEHCIVPIRGGGVHVERAGSLAAVERFREALELEPESLRFRWLLNVAYMTLGQYPDGVPAAWRIPPEIFESDHDIGRFPDVAPLVGVDLVGLAGGVVMDDLTGDGLLDVMVSDWAIDKPLRLLVNEGDGAFSDRTEAAGLEGEVGGLNLCQADYDNDGDVDVLVLRGAWLGTAGRFPNSLLRNRGDGTFEDVTEAAGLLSFFPTQTGAWGDYDGDGWVDLFIGNESRPGLSHPCELFHNNGDGTFTEVAAAVGLDHVGLVKGVAWGDYDNDGRVDLYLSRFSQTNILFHNEGPGGPGGWSFRDVTASAGVALPIQSFPVWFFDYDNDGWEDLVVASFGGFRFDGSSLDSVVADYLGRDVKADRTHLFRNNGDGTFSNVAPELGLGEVMLAMGANFGDLDNDGFLDCYFGTGDPYLGTLIPNRMFRNDGGQAFQDVTTSGGFGHVQKGHGIAFGDLDGDGDQDVYAVLGGAHSGDVYQNVLFENPGNGNHWLTLRLVGTDSNRSAIGARIRVDLETPKGDRSVHVTCGSGGSFGASSLQQEIGLGDALAARRIEVRWPSGLDQSFTDVPLDRVLELREGAAAATELESRTFTLGAGPGMHGHHHPQPGAGD